MDVSSNISLLQDISLLSMPEKTDLLKGVIQDFLNTIPLGQRILEDVEKGYIGVTMDDYLYEKFGVRYIPINNTIHLVINDINVDIVSDIYETFGCEDEKYLTFVFNPENKLTFSED